MFNSEVLYVIGNSRDTHTKFPASVTNAAGHTVLTTFNAREGNPITIEDANELLTHMAYDPFGRQTMSWSPRNHNIEIDCIEE